MLRTQELARRSGLTSRTLRHYDEIGLLPPAAADPGGQRWYGPDELLRLQRILILRELGLPLEEIGRVLDGETDDVVALARHVGQLRAQQARIERMIRAVEGTITRLEEETAMDDAEMFDGFADDPYADEAQRRWPDQYAESQRRLKRLSTQEQRELFDRGGAITGAVGAQFTAGAAVDDPRCRRSSLGTTRGWTPSGRRAARPISAWGGCTSTIRASPRTTRPWHRAWPCSCATPWRCGRRPTSPAATRLAAPQQPRGGPMLALVVRFQVRPERVADFDRLVEALIPHIDAEEPGTLTYLSTSVDDDANARVLIEVYDDEEAFALHEEQPHTQRFLREREALLDLHQGRAPDGARR